MNSFSAPCAAKQRAARARWIAFIIIQAYAACLEIDAITRAVSGEIRGGPPEARATAMRKRTEKRGYSGLKPGVFHQEAPRFSFL